MANGLIGLHKFTEVVANPQRTLSFLLNALRNWLINRWSNNSPIIGNFVLMIETRAANTGVKGKLAAWAFIMLRAKSPRPLMRFSEKSSGTTCLMLPTLILLTIPVIDLRNASQESRWYSALLRSCPAAAWRARSLAGGIYTPPEREDVSFANSATASNSFSFVSPFFSSVFSSSTAAIRAASWRSRSALRTGSTSSTLGTSALPRGGGGENDLRRTEGGSPSGERERDLQPVETARAKSTGEKERTSFFSCEV